MLINKETMIGEPPEWDYYNEYVGFDMTEAGEQEIASLMTLDELDWAVWVEADSVRLLIRCIESEGVRDCRTISITRRATNTFDFRRSWKSS